MKATGNASLQTGIPESMFYSAHHPRIALTFFTTVTLPKSNTCILVNASCQLEVFTCVSSMENRFVQVTLV